MWGHIKWIYINDSLWHNTQIYLKNNIPGVPVYLFVPIFGFSKKCNLSLHFLSLLSLAKFKNLLKKFDYLIFTHFFSLPFISIH